VQKCDSGERHCVRRQRRRHEKGRHWETKTVSSRNPRQRDKGKDFKVVVREVE
jgi:hypothetical protein